MQNKITWVFFFFKGRDSRGKRLQKGGVAGEREEFRPGADCSGQEGVRRGDISPVGYNIRIQQYLKAENMEGSQQSSTKRYNKIDLETRKRLVYDVVEDDRSLSKTAKKLGIKVSTAKAIVKRYKEQGTFFEIKSDKEARLREQERHKTGQEPSEQQRMTEPQNITSDYCFPFVADPQNMPIVLPFTFYTYQYYPFAPGTPAWIQNQ